MLQAFLDDAALHARYLQRARELADANERFLQSHRSGDAVPARAAAPAASGAATAATATTSSAASAGRPGMLWQPDEADDLDFAEGQLGLPKALAPLIGELALQLPEQRMPGFPAACIEAIEPGADLRGVAPALIAWMFDAPQVGALRFGPSAEVAAAAAEVGRLHAREATGESVPRAEWTAARRVAQALADRSGSSDADASIAGLAALAAWSCATSRDVALQAFRAWGWSVAALPVYAALGYSVAQAQAHNAAVGEFWSSTAALRKTMHDEGRPRHEYEAIFEQRHPQMHAQHKVFAQRSKEASLQMCECGADHLLVLLRQASAGR